MKLLFTICSLVLGVALHAQTPRFNHHPMGGEWEDTRVNKIYEAGSGLLWFGADRGLFQYDGRNFIFWPSGDSVQRAATAIYEDRQGTLWVGYEDGAVFTKPKTGELTLWDPQEGLPKSHNRYCGRRQRCVVAVYLRRRPLLLPTQTAIQF
ncbi:MAG: hypothetical protein IPN33_27015 [Saprospiraceae bacterium]|nr:hypothetical protein [Saprospiraceae bacterium]